MGEKMVRKMRKYAGRRKKRALAVVGIGMLVGVIVVSGWGKRGNEGEWKEWVEKLKVTVRDGNGVERSVVVVTASNYAFREYVGNFNCTLSRYGRVVTPLVVALDLNVADWLRERGFATVGMGMKGDMNEVKFGSEGFNLLSKMKLLAVNNLLDYQVDVIFSDADIVWCTDVIHHLVQAAYDNDSDHGGVVDMLMQTAWPRSLLNSGFYYVKSNRHTIQLFRRFLSYPGSAENDQVIVNKVFCRSHAGGRTLFPTRIRRHPAAPHREMPYGCNAAGATVRVLEGTEWPTGGEIMNGHEKIFHMDRKDIVRMCQKGDVKVVHNNCVMAEKKKARMIVKGLWWIRPDGICANSPMPATRQARRRCGGAKCGREGDLRRYPQLVV